MRLPSVKTMTRNEIPQPEKVRARMEQYRDYCRVNFDRKISVDNCLSDISVLINGFGPEYIPNGSNQQSPAIDYVNMGDTYDTTVMFVNGNFVIGNWGSIVERGNYQ